MSTSASVNKIVENIDSGISIDKPAAEPGRVPWPEIRKPLAIFTAAFVLIYLLPVEKARFAHSVIEALALTKWYAREHVLLCLVPAFFIAGAIAVFVSQAAVMRYLGADANKILSYGVASVSGSILAVCSCTVLPMFAGIWKRGAGLGPAIAFLYSGPAVNVLAVILTARILGPEYGLARAVGAIVFSVVIGLIMHIVFRNEEKVKALSTISMPEPEVARPLWQNALFFAVMLGVLVSATWAQPKQAFGVWHSVYTVKWPLTGFFALLLGTILVRWMRVKTVKVAVAAVVIALFAWIVPGNPVVPFSAGIVSFIVLLTSTRGETETWFLSTWDFARQILPLLFIGVLAAGFLLGRPGSEGLIPSGWVGDLVGGNTVRANLFASIVGAFMYFATLTEVPILQGLIGAGMGKGPALALLLAGPALSLPNMLVIRSVIGTRKTVWFVALVILMATFSGMIFGRLF